MSYKIQFSDNDRILECFYSGQILYQEIAACEQERMADEARFKKVRILIADYSSASLSLVTGKDVREDSQSTKIASEINPDITLIGIMPGELEFGLSRMWQGFSQTLPWTTHVVRSREECNAIVASLNGPE